MIGRERPILYEPKISYANLAPSDRVSVENLDAICGAGEWPEGIADAQAGYSGGYDGVG